MGIVITVAISIMNFRMWLYMWGVSCQVSFCIGKSWVVCVFIRRCTDVIFILAETKENNLLTEKLFIVFHIFYSTFSYFFYNNIYNTATLYLLMSVENTSCIIWTLAYTLHHLLPILYKYFYIFLLLACLLLVYHLTHCCYRNRTGCTCVN